MAREGCRARPLGVDVHPVMAEVNPGSNSLPSMFEKVRPTGLFESVSQPYTRDFGADLLRRSD